VAKAGAVAARVANAARAAADRRVDCTAGLLLPEVSPACGYFAFRQNARISKCDISKIEIIGPVAAEGGALSRQ
jgi:hypothetical protein